MIETHPYLSFVPKNSKYLLLGSYPAKNSGDWFYGSGRNQFWRILEQVYGTELVTRKSKEELFTKLHLAVSDIIYSCERKSGNSLDTNLINITYNNKVIEEILANNKIQTVYFTSKFVENRFRKVFKYLIERYPEIELVTLPSPSPRYALMSKEEKIKRYKELMPNLQSAAL